MRLLLMNPNTTVATTERMVAIAAASAPDGVTIAGLTASFGEPLITHEAALAVAADAVETSLAAADLSAVSGVIVAAFGDPGLPRCRARLSCPVTGIAEAGLAEAAADGRSFAVVTTTPGLVRSIAALVADYGYAARFIGTVLTEGDSLAVMSNPALLAEALTSASRRAIAAGADAIVIGGGPLAEAARAIAPLLPVPVIEPIPAAVRLAVKRASSGLIGRVGSDELPPKL